MFMWFLKFWSRDVEALKGHRRDLEHVTLRASGDCASVLCSSQSLSASRCPFISIFLSAKQNIDLDLQ